MVTIPSYTILNDGILYLRENNPPYTKHDLLFKRLIETFFAEFIEAFFPNLYKKINFHSLTFLSEEIIPSLYDENERRLDIVAEVSLKSTDALIVIHIEPQSYVQSNFNERMFHYFSQLFRKVNKPIIPIAIFSYKESWDVNDFTMCIEDFEIVRFRYLTLHLRKMNWREFISQNNPVSAALLSKMGYTEKERIKVKLEFLRILTSLQINLEKRDILMGFFHSYLTLNEEEEEILMEHVKKQKNAQQIFEVTNPYVEKGKRIGREEGRKEGRKEAKERLQIEMALKMLKKNFEIEDICDILDLTHEQVTKLKESL